MISIHQCRMGAIAAALLLASATGAQAADLLVNGDFEAGDLSGWSATGPLDFAGADAFAAHSGGYGAFFGPETPVTMSQSVATTAGGTYEVSFWLSLQDSAQPNNFSWTWNGVTQAVSFDNAAGFGYEKFTALVTGGDASSTLSFNFTDPQSFWLLDDVSVAAVPEPSTGLMMGAGALLLALVGRRRIRVPAKR
jgi:hypothetical protein